MGIDDAAVVADNVNGSADDAPAGAILFGHFPAFIDKKREGEFVLGGEFPVGVGALSVDAIYGGAEAFKCGPIVSDFAELFRADGGIVTGVEDEYYGLAFKRFERDRALIFVCKREGRGDGADGQWGTK